MEVNQLAAAESAAACFYCQRAGRPLEPCCEKHPGTLVCADHDGCLDYLLAQTRPAADPAAAPGDGHHPAWCSRRCPCRTQPARVLADAMARARAAVDAAYALVDAEPADRDYMTSRGDAGMPAAHALYALLAVLDHPGASRPALTAGDIGILGQALADAVTYRDPAGSCPDCDTHPAELCQDHAADIDKADAYLALADSLGIEVDR